MICCGILNACCPDEVHLVFIRDRTHTLSPPRKEVLFGTYNITDITQIRCQHNPVDPENLSLRESATHHRTYLSHGAPPVASILTSPDSMTDTSVPSVRNFQADRAVRFERSWLCAPVRRTTPILNQDRNIVVAFVIQGELVETGHQLGRHGENEQGPENWDHCETFITFK